MLIEYKKPNILTVAYRVSDKQCDTVRFMPGVNELSRKKWELIYKHPKVLKHIDTGILEVLIAEDPKEGSNGILDLKPQEAAKVIKKTFDLEKLEDWKSKDSRKAVINSLEFQIKHVNSQGVKEGAEKE